MTFMHLADFAGAKYIDEEAYADYLHENRSRFPPRALAFASAEWHYDYNHSRCPHDASLLTLQVIEDKAAESEFRKIDIRVRLLGAYHDGHIDLAYLNVQKFSVNVYAFKELSCFRGFGDWLIDEIRLLELGRVVHEVQWSNAKWQIECDDIDCRWTPIPGASRAEDHLGSIFDPPKQ